MMQLEAAHAVEITKVLQYVDKKEDPQILIVRTHQHNTNSAVLETARCLKIEVQRETRKLKDSITEIIYTPYVFCVRYSSNLNCDHTQEICHSVSSTGHKILKSAPSLG